MFIKPSKLRETVAPRAPDPASAKQTEKQPDPQPSWHTEQDIVSIIASNLLDRKRDVQALLSTGRELRTMLYTSQAVAQSVRAGRFLNEVFGTRQISATKIGLMGSVASDVPGSALSNVLKNARLRRVGSYIGEMREFDQYEEIAPVIGRLSADDFEKLLSIAASRAKRRPDATGLKSLLAYPQHLSDSRFIKICDAVDALPAERAEAKLDIYGSLIELHDQCSPRQNKRLAEFWHAQASDISLQEIALLAHGEEKIVLNADQEKRILAFVAAFPQYAFALRHVSADARRAYALVSTHDFEAEETMEPRLQFLSEISRKDREQLLQRAQEVPDNSSMLKTVCEIASHHQPFNDSEFSHIKAYLDASSRESELTILSALIPAFASGRTEDHTYLLARFKGRVDRAVDASEDLLLHVAAEALIANERGVASDALCDILLKTVKDVPYERWDSSMFLMLGRDLAHDQIPQAMAAHIDGAIGRLTRSTPTRFHYPFIRFMTDQQKQTVMAYHVKRGTSAPFGAHFTHFTIEQQMDYLRSVRPSARNNKVGREEAVALSHAATTITTLDAKTWQVLAAALKLSHIP